MGTHLSQDLVAATANHSRSLSPAGHRVATPSHSLGGALRRHDANVEGKAVAGTR